MSKSKTRDAICYLSGPMRGLSGYNYDTFNEAEEALKGAYGCQILNPAKNFAGDTTRPVSDYMRVDVCQVATATHIVLLPGWEKSEGSKLEIAVAKACDLTFMLATKAGKVWFFEEIETPQATSSIRGDALDEAKSLITGDRNNSYGPPTQDFRRSADAMTAYGYRHTQLAAGDPPCGTCGARPLKAHDTAIAVDCVKTSRIMWQPTKRDSWVDKAGYAGCGYEAAIEEMRD